MKFTMESDFAKHVKSGEQFGVYLLYGSQTYLIERYEKLLVKKALDGDMNDFNYHRFLGDSLELQAFYDAVESLPLFAQGRCVALDLLPDQVGTGEMKELCAILGDVPASTCVIVTVKEDPAKKEKWNMLLKACEKAGAAIELGARRRTDTLRFLRDRAQKNGCELSSEVGGYLIERCTDDLQLLCNEVDKLCAYAAGREIGRQDVDAVVSPVLQSQIYDLSKAILRGNYTRAMELVECFFDQREQPSRVLAVLSGAFCDLYRGFCACQAGVPAAQACAALGYPKNREFVLKNAISDSSRYQAGQLGKMLEALADADFMLKTSGGNERVVLEQTITKLFMLAERGSYA